jgi:hypothetical protein
MKKTLKTLITGIILAFFLTITISLGGAQNSPAPQPESSASLTASAPVLLENETLFVIQAPLGGVSSQERAQRLRQNLREFADNQALSLDQLEVYGRVCPSLCRSDGARSPLLTVIIGETPEAKTQDAEN